MAECLFSHHVNSAGTNILVMHGAVGPFSPEGEQIKLFMGPSPACRSIIHGGVGGGKPHTDLMGLTAGLFRVFGKVFGASCGAQIVIEVVRFTSGGLKVGREEEDITKHQIKTECHPGQEAVWRLNDEQLHTGFDFMSRT